MSPNAASLFKRCARTSAPAIPLSQAHLSLRLSRSPLPPPLVSLAMTQYTMPPHGPHTHRFISTIHIQTLNLTAHRPSSSTISMLMSCTRTNTNTNTTTTTTTNISSSNNSNNSKIPPRVSLPSNQSCSRAASHAFLTSLFPVVNYSPIKVASPSPYSSPPYTIYNAPNQAALPPLLSPLPSQHSGYVAPGLVSGASMFY